MMFKNQEVSYHFSYVTCVSEAYHEDQRIMYVIKINRLLSF